MRWIIRSRSTHLQDAQVLYRLGDGVGGLRLKLADPQNAPAFIANLIPASAQDKVWGARLDVSKPQLF